MRKKNPVNIQTLDDASDTDPSWPLENVDGLKISPQAFIGTHKSIQTSNPNFIEIKFKARYMINPLQMSADRKYFYILENSYTRNIPTACFCLPDNCICPGDDTITTYYFDRGIYSKDGYIWCTGCVGGEPTVFYDEIKYQCCCITCYDSVNQKLGCTSRSRCGERIRSSPFDRCCFCVQNKYCWLCNLCGLFGPINGQPIILCPIETGLSKNESKRLKGAMDKAREEWQDHIDIIVDKHGHKNMTATQALIAAARAEEKKMAPKPVSRFAKPKIAHESAHMSDPTASVSTAKSSRFSLEHLPNVVNPGTPIDQFAPTNLDKTHGFDGSHEHRENSMKMYRMWEDEKIVLTHQKLKSMGKIDSESKSAEFQPFSPTNPRKGSPAGDVTFSFGAPKEPDANRREPDVIPTRIPEPQPTTASEPGSPVSDISNNENENEGKGRVME